ncbi:MAG TPA: pentapeptide repeat-containing protein [Methylophaga sp.]|nr:pentapeptide repeat-containing protein [Methylophaga sp.]
MESVNEVSNMQSARQKWFTRHNGEVKGPFTLALLKSNWLLGRLNAQDEISEDRKHWRPIGDIIDLELIHTSTSIPEDADQAKRYLDERNGFDRRQETLATEQQLQQRKQQRRAREPAELVVQRQLRSRLLEGYRQHQERWLWPVLSTVFLMLGIFLAAIFYPTTFPQSKADCEAPAAPGVNWENCVFNPTNLQAADLSNSNLRNSVLRSSNLMNTNLSNTDLMYADLSRSDLSYANLTNSKLKGADLRQADLSNSDLRQADLTFADLRGARLGGANLQGVMLSQAIWLDGRICAPGSISECRLTVPELM